MSYHVTPVSLVEHRDALVALWSGHFRDPREHAYCRERFSWLYDDSPGSHAYTCVATESDYGRVIGCASFFEADKYAGARLLKAGVLVGFIVDRGHRTLAAALALQRTIATDAWRMGFDLLIGRPNMTASVVTTRAGYTSIGESQDWVVMLDRARRPLDARAAGHAYETSDAADDRFDELFERARSHYPIIGTKTTGFLNWRFNTAFQEARHHYFCLLSGSARTLAGYVTYYHVNQGLFIVDAFGMAGTDDSLEHLIRHFLTWATDEGYRWVGLSYFGTAAFERGLERCAFERTRDAEPIVACLNPQTASQLGPTVLDRNSWFAFGGETHIF